jgi:hypothetical protein
MGSGDKTPILGTVKETKISLAILLKCNSSYNRLDILSLEYYKNSTKFNFFENIETLGQCTISYIKISDEIEQIQSGRA